jgi:hypothetical protein
MKVGKTGKIVSAVAVVAAVVCGSSYWVGSQIEQEFRENVDGASRPGVTVNVVDYQRSIFRATARTDLVFQIPSDEVSSGTEPVTVPVIHSISHGPLSALPAAARIHSEVQLTQLTADDIAQLNEIFDGDPFFPVLNTAISWTGGVRCQLALSKVDKLRFQRRSDSGAVHGIELENVRATVDASIKNGVLGKGEVKFDADRIVMERETKEAIDSPSLTLLLENIELRIFSDPWQAIVDILGEQEQATTTASWLQRKPAFAIKDMHARWPEGMATGSFRIAYVGDAGSAASLGSISGDLKMVIPRALAIRHMSAQVAEEIADSLEGGEENEVNIEKETKEQVDKQMAAMLKDGIFVEKGDALSVDARLRDGELNLNGEVRPVELLLDLIPPFF